MPEFKNAQEVEQICYDMKMADWPRSGNRARIDKLFNGWAPYSEQEVLDNSIEINVNFLEATRLGHDARAQFYGAFTKPSNYFTLTTDYGPVHKRAKWGKIVTAEMNKIMKRSLPYFECFRSKFAQDVLHGVGISAWPDSDQWCPDPMGMDDVLIPARTYLHMKNLPFFPIYRSFTGMELRKLTSGPNLDPGWNMDMVEAAIRWMDKETMQLMGSNWPEIWSLEKQEERVKGDGGFYVGDQVPTLDCWDFYFYDHTGKESGWKRKIILDSWATPASYTANARMERKQGDIYKDGGRFIYEGNGFFASDRSEIVAFQFADLSAVAPFQYHSVRSLGFLLFAPCHLMNRMQCKFSEAVFEALMMYFRVKSMDDIQRALKINLVNRGFIDDTITPLKAEERYQVNTALVEAGFGQLKEIIQQNSSSYTQNKESISSDKEKTATQVMAEVNSATSLTSVALQQAYQYQEYEYREIKRRFFKKMSDDPDVKRFRAACLKQGMPEKYLEAEAWESHSEQVMGAGNKTLEMAIANQLMQWRDKFDPEPQRKILYDATLALTDSAAKADMLVPPDQMHISDSIHDAQLSAGTLMRGLPVAIKTGMNHIEYVEALLPDMALIIQKAKQRGVPTPEELDGITNLAQHIAQHIQIIGEDEQEKPRAKEFSDKLGKLMNEVKALAQRLQQQMEAQQKQNGDGKGGEALAKIQARMMEAQAKIDQGRQSHAAKTAQRDIAFHKKSQQDEVKFKQDLAHKAQEHQLKMATEAASTAHEIQMNRMKSLSEPTNENND